MQAHHSPARLPGPQRYPQFVAEAEADALIERCYAGLDAATLRREVAARLKAAAGVDAAFIATVDPATLLFTSAISEEPLIPASGWTVPGVRPAACSSIPMSRTRSTAPGN